MGVKMVVFLIIFLGGGILTSDKPMRRAFKNDVTYKTFLYADAIFSFYISYNLILFHLLLFCLRFRLHKI